MALRTALAEVPNPLEQHVKMLIKDALNQYTKDTTVLHDYALRSAGARIVPEFTSETLWNLSVGRRWLLKVQSLLSGIDLEALRGLSPETVLLDDMKHGGCWASPGSHVVIWGLVHSNESLFAPPDLDSQLTTTVITGGSLIGTFLEIISFEYDIFNQTHIQTFAVPREDNEPPEVLSNWGSEVATCLYRAHLSCPIINRYDTDGMSITFHDAARLSRSRISRIGEKLLGLGVREGYSRSRYKCLSRNHFDVYPGNPRV
ncbi:hypothetical protein BD769DRAFT_1398050 [Suillus cothurnatus]|nr:hypothetical protein BD769DRAFT_1398050 [Suillus cothurnatus]